MKKCKCVYVPNDDFYKDALIKLKLGEIYYYEFDKYEEVSGDGLFVEFYYSVFTLDYKFVLGGLEENFHRNFLDLTEWRKQRIEKLLCNN